MSELRLGKHRLRTPAVCGSVSGKNLDEMRAGVARAIEHGADLVELRMDGLKSVSGWGKLVRKDIPIILTNRPERESGGFIGKEEDRVGLLLEGIKLGVSCVDIELSTPKKFRGQAVSKAKRSGVTVLMSHHDFSTTPPAETLMRIAKDLKKAGCDMLKIVTFAKSPGDGFRMLDFLIRARGEFSVPVIAFAMGEEGRMTRFISPLLGSPIVYAAAAKETALGQLDVKTMKEWTHELMRKEVRD